MEEGESPFEAYLPFMLIKRFRATRTVPCPISFSVSFAGSRENSHCHFPMDADAKSSDRVAMGGSVVLARKSHSILSEEEWLGSGR